MDQGIIRWSPHPSRDEFLTVNLNYRIIQLYEAKAHAQNGRFDCEKTSTHNEFPGLTTLDWSPKVRGLLALGTSQGDVYLLRVDDDSNSSFTLGLKYQRPSQAVAFNTTGLLAVGLDRVRSDVSLHIWDINQCLEGWDSKQRGWGTSKAPRDPLRTIDTSFAVTSIKFFEDQPHTIVLGLKNQFVRIFDLREPSTNVINFKTRCNNNLAIDHADPNYFASSSLETPSVVVWDRRAIGRNSASPVYLESVDKEEIPWGSALKLNHVVETEKGSSIRQLRYCRDQRGALGILSSAGHLQVLHTNREFVKPSTQPTLETGPELLEVTKSFDFEHPYFEGDRPGRYENRIVSFDWVTLGSSELSPRVVALRANGSFEILETPPDTAGQLSKLIPWVPPHRLGDPYFSFLEFADKDEAAQAYVPLYATEAKTSIPVFGPGRFRPEKTEALAMEAVDQHTKSKADPVLDLLVPPELRLDLDPSFEYQSLISRPCGEQLQSIRLAQDKYEEVRAANNERLENSKDTVTTPTSKQIHSSRELHDRSHYSTLNMSLLSKPEKELVNHVMLKRALEGYLFNCETNKAILSDDYWLQDVWDWIGSADLAAKDDGMVSLPVDLSYMGVYPIWMNQLGRKAASRLIDSTITPDSTQWERLIGALNKHSGRDEFNGVETAKPQHRQLCLSLCGLGKSPAELDAKLLSLEEDGKYTKAAAWALFEGYPKRAVDILKRGGTDLLFVAMALEIKLRSSTTLDLGKSDWKTALEQSTQMRNDPYLRAIYGLISTGDWSVIADEASLPLRARVVVALRNFDDAHLSRWLSKQMDEAIRTGDIEGIILAGITDPMVDILAKYVEKFGDYQTPILIISFCYPRYIEDFRCGAWRKQYRDYLQRYKKYILRVKFEQQSTIKSRLRDGTPVIKAPPRQVTIRCLNCDAQSANDLRNSGAAPTIAPGNYSVTADERNPLMATGINAGLCCPKCGSHLNRCAVCMEIVGVPRSDRPEQSSDPATRRMANFPTFCLKCKHVTHMDHSVAWFSRHLECPVPECQCQCNQGPNQQREIE
ncbi:hypothetical protein F5884DRAFT_194861 [Xylogone sp. PMI_703]|nr:hypothetical protein F5884DRAFT_194861 [Xylogone sp. PMI_703]